MCRPTGNVFNAAALCYGRKYAYQPLNLNQQNSFIRQLSGFFNFPEKLSCSKDAARTDFHP